MPKPEVVSAEYQTVARIEWLNHRFAGGCHDLIVPAPTSLAVVETLIADESTAHLQKNMKWLHFLQRAVVTVRHPKASGQTSPHRGLEAPFDEVLRPGDYSSVGEVELVTGYVDGKPSLMSIPDVVKEGHLTDFTAEWFGGLVELGNYEPPFYDELLPLLELRQS